MKKITFSLAILLLCTIASKAQNTISIDEVQKHVGDSVKICTRIYGGIYLDRSQNKPTFLNAGAAYPNALLTLVIWGDVRSRFKEAPETYYKDKEICVTGKIILYKDKPEIIIYDEKQISLKE